MSGHDSSRTLGGNPPANYEHYFVPAIGEPLARDLISAAALQMGERVLDVASGTGIVARLAAPRVGVTGTVTGVDINPGMLAVARSATPEGVTIEWHQADAAVMPLPDDSFDVVLCQMGIQFVPDKDAALREMRRVLADRGRLLFNVPGPTPPPMRKLGETLGRHVGPEAAGFIEQVFSMHEDDEIRALADGAGFKDVSIQSGTKKLRLPPPADFLWQYLGSTPLAIAIGQIDDRTRAAIEQDVVEHWKPFTDDDHLELEIEVTTATGLN